MKKRILQICAIDLTAKHLLKPLIIQLMEEGHEVHTACANTGLFGELEQEGLIMKEIIIERKISPISNTKSIIELIKLIRKEKYEIIHVHTPVASIIGRIAGKLTGVNNIIYTAHGFYFHDGMTKKQYKFYYTLEKIFARFFTDWLLVQSKEDYDLCVKNNFKNKKRLIHLSNGVDLYNRFNPNLFNETRRKEIRKDIDLDDEIVFTFIGRLIKEKGIFELTDAFNSLNTRYSNLKLLLIGELLESERDQISYQDLSKRIEVNENIIKAGFREDIPELLSITDIFVLPSHREGLPRSIIEAMAMAKPVIATNIRGCREEVKDGINGYLVGKENTIELTNKMAVLIENKQLRDSFGINSRNICEEEFDERKILSKQIDLFNTLKN